MTLSAYESGMQIGLFIDGVVRKGRGAGFDLINPANEEVLAALHGASELDVADALASAQRGMADWLALPPQQRYRILLRSAEELRKRAPVIARTLSLEQGKTLPEASVEVELAAETFEFYAGEVLRLDGRIIPARTAQTLQTVTPRPIGVAACFVPWNFPLLLAARKVAPALVAGCACVLKPAEETVGNALALAECLHAAGLPAGAISVVFGDAPRISEHLISAPAVGAITFTGSTAVGRVVARTAAEWLKPCTLELGGHAAVIVLDDCDIEAATSTAVLGKTRNAGQVCTSPTRFYVDRSIHDRFAKRFADKLAEIRVGSASDPQSQMGPLANARRIEAAEALVRDAVAKGARVATGGSRIGNRGFFFEPTLLADVPGDADVLSIEPFCPIATISPYDSIDEALSRANIPQAGLAGYVFGQDFSRTQTVAKRLEVGQVAINNFSVSHVEAPFGGIKESGYGVEGSTAAIEPFLARQYIHHVIPA